MANNSVEHCEERIRTFDAEYRENQQKASDALKELKWWQDELMSAQRAEREEANRNK